MPAIAEQVDHDILAKALPVVESGARDFDDRLRIVAIDVEDRRLNSLRDVRRVGAGARLRRGRGKPDLIIDDDMDRAAGAVPAQIRQFEQFGHQTLPGEGGVAVHQDAGHFLALGVAALVLLGARFAEHDRVDRFEVRRIGR